MERGKERLGRMTRKLQVSESQNQLLNEKLLEGEKLLKKEKNEVCFLVFFSVLVFFV